MPQNEENWNNRPCNNQNKVALLVKKFENSGNNISFTKDKTKSFSRKILPHPFIAMQTQKTSTNKKTLSDNCFVIGQEEPSEVL